MVDQPPDVNSPDVRVQASTDNCTVRGVKVANSTNLTCGHILHVQDNGSGNTFEDLRIEDSHVSEHENCQNDSTIVMCALDTTVGSLYLDGVSGNVASLIDGFLDGHGIHHLSVKNSDLSGIESHPDDILIDGVENLSYRSNQPTIPDNGAMYYLGSSTTISDRSETQIEFDEIEYDNIGELDPETGG